MSETEHAYAAVSSLLSILGLWVMLFWLYRDYRVDLFRQRMSKIRDELFDLADRGEIAFDHPAYGLWRNTLNGFIRSAHRLTLLQVVLFLCANRRQPLPALETPFEARWRTASKDLEPEVRTELEDSIRRAHILVIKHLVHGSPLLLLSVVVPLLLLFLGRSLLSIAMGRLGNQLSRIDAAAMVIGAGA